MATQKFLTVIDGRERRVAAIDSSAGAADAGKIPALDASGRLGESMMPVGLGTDMRIVPASEALASGSFVNLWDDAGTLKARKADATTAGKEADGFVLAAVDSAADATVYFEGMNTQLADLTPNARYYLATTAGGVTATPPDAAGNVLQYLGKALSATELSFRPDDGIILA
jgi:hypothetical protein